MGVEKPSLLATAHELELPIWVASPGDSTIGLNLAAIYTASPERGPHVDPAADVTEMSALVLDAKRHGGRQVGRRDLRRRRAQELPAADRAAAAGDPGRVREAATTTSSRSPTRAPTRAACRARRRPRRCRGARSIPSCCPTRWSAYLDSTIAMPLMASYVLARCKPRKPRRLYKRLKEMEEALRAEYLKSDLYKRYWPAEAAEGRRARRRAPRRSCRPPRRRCRASRAAARDR